MTTPLRRTGILAALAATSFLHVLGTASTARAEPADDLVRKVQTFHAAARDLEARFTQDVVHHQGTTTNTGRVYLKQPGMMRWDYIGPDPYLYVSDGKSYWVYDVAQRLAVTRSLRSTALPREVPGFFANANLAREFTIRVAPIGVSEMVMIDPRTPFHLRPEGGTVLRLVPRTADPRIREIYLVIDPRTGQVHQSLTISPEGNTNHIVFSHLRVNTGLPASLFSWTPPAGTKVLKAP
jgi:outer membrane lipoprotein carrier protein